MVARWTGAHNTQTSYMEATSLHQVDESCAGCAGRTKHTGRTSKQADGSCTQASGWVVCLSIRTSHITVAHSIQTSRDKHAHERQAT